MAELANITPLNPDDFSFETYSTSDESLLNVNFSSSVFDPTKDYVEFFVYDLNNNIVDSVIGYENYSLLDNNLYVDPTQDSINLNVDTGTVNVLYNFYRPELSSSFTTTYYISEISSNRTELRLSTNNLSELEVINSTNEFIAYREAQSSFPDFYLNFGNNQLVIANNIKLDNGTVLIKLYEALPVEFDVKSQLWVIRKLSEGVAYQLDFTTNLTTTTPRLNYISGPNYNLGIKDQLNNSSEYTNYQSYTSSSVTSSQYQINSLFNTPGIEINVDYTNYSNFVNFSSATERLNNFYYKASLIESASNQLTVLDALSPQPTSVVATQNTLKNIIDTTITNFDGYEYYLYFESGSTAWPKTNSTYPYTNSSTSSVAAQAWITASLITASNYDNTNQNYLKYSIPEYIRDDSENAQYMTFLNMVGQFFDDYVWVYIKDTTEKYNADNRIDYGVSKELVAQVLRDFGIKLYQSNYGTSDLFTAFLGATESGSLFPFPYVTSSLPTPTGYEYVDTYISSSTSPVPLDDIQKRVYKRIYHNLPYLLKTKGTIESIRTLATIYGIPDTLLQINEFGGKDKDNSNDWDLWFDKFNYQYNTETEGWVSSSFIANGDWTIEGGNRRPKSVEFRFKAPSSGSTGAVDYAVNHSDTVLWSLDDGSEVLITLTYTGSGFTSGSYSGSIADPNNQYGFLTLYPTVTADPSISASLYLPFFDGGWWSVLAAVNDSTASLYAGNKIYKGDDGSKLGFTGSISVTGVDDSLWDAASNSYFPSDNRNAVGSYEAFSGSYQEVRYYTVPLSESVFHDYIMNPMSIEGNGVNTSNTQLLFRASLGGELYTGSTSIHPKVSGSYTLDSFASTSTFVIKEGTFTTNTEYIFLDQFPAGLRNRNTDKIKQLDLVLPEGNTTNTGSLGTNSLSPLDSIQQKSFTQNNYTPNINLLEVTYSPQNEINDDIISSIGYFNIGDYIGDPRLTTSSANYYPDFNALRDEYFLKYITNYDLADFVRLIKYFDNSFFKMVKDFVPARTSLASGITIKQHLLERQKYPLPQPSQSSHDYTGSIGQTATLVNGQRQYIHSTDFESFPIETVSGSTGGTMPAGIELTFNSSSFPVNTSNQPVINLSASGYYLLEFIVNSSDPLDYFTIYDGVDNGGTALITGYSGGFSQIVNVSTGNLYIEDSGFLDALTFTQFSSSITQYYSEIVDTPLGQTTKLIDNKAVYDGEFSGSSIPVGLNIDKTLYLQSVLSPSTEYGNDVADLGNFTPIGFDFDSDKSYYLSYLITNNEAFPILVSVLNEQDSLINPNLAITVGAGSTHQVFQQQIDNSYSDLTSNLYIYSDNGSNLNYTITNFIVYELEAQDPDIFALDNNVLNTLPSSIFYDLDFSTSQLSAINQQSIISASQRNELYLPKAPVQDYNWYARRSIIPRYSGSVNTAADYNSEQGFAPIDKTNPIILEYNWGGGTYPEIQGVGALSLNQMLFVNQDRDAVNIFSANQLGFTGSVETVFPINSSPTFNQYSTSVNTVTGTTVAAYGFSTPQIANYFIPFNQTGSTFVLENNGANLDFATNTTPIHTTTINTSGYYTTSSISSSAQDIVSEISTSLAQGNRWFISAYYQLPVEIQGTLNPWFGTAQSLDVNPESFILEKLGTYEIISTSGTKTLVMNLNTGLASETFGGGSNDNGCLIWRAVQGSYMLLKGNTLSGLGKGGLITSTPSALVENEFEYITQKYGSNPKPS